VEPSHARHLSLHCETLTREPGPYARRFSPLWGDCVEKLPFGDARFSGRPTSAAFKKSAGGPANLSRPIRTANVRSPLWFEPGRPPAMTDFGASRPSPHVSEGPLTAPMPGVQPARRELVFM